MEVVDIWTGRGANALRIALRLTNERFAEHLGTSVRTVAKWNAQADLVPVPELQRALDTALSQASEADQTRFWHLADHVQPDYVDGPTIQESGVRDALRWLDDRMKWPDGEALKRVGASLKASTEEGLRSAGHRRAGVARTRIAEGVRAYYEIPASGAHGFYAANFGDQRHITSILTVPAWLGLRQEISPDQDNLVLASTVSHREQFALDDSAANYAITRLAGTLALGTRLVNAPTYQLLDVHISPTRLAGTLGVTDFVTYALTYDLMENELTDALDDATPGNLPLRDRYLPDVSALTDLSHRLCVGGPIALTAIARNRNGRQDYALLVQERSGNVLNAARRLAVIPKAFHQPLIDMSEDSNLAMTIEREMEEELFGRPEFDLDGKAQRRADPMRRDLLSDPMRWLADRRNDGTWQMECTAFGINAISGNFEFASLVVINDPQWWDLYGGHIEANWEVGGLHRYSTLDTGMLESLAGNPSWSNEGLFAFLEGIRRLSELDSGRVTVSSIDVELQK